MKRLIIWLALLLPFIANAQVNGTIQKTASSGTIRGSFGSLGIDTIPRVTGVFVNGYILKYNASTNKWYASPDPTLVGLQDSLTKKANRTFDNVASGAIANVKLANSTISGVALGSNLNTLTLGNGLIGTSYNGSSAVTARVDTTTIQTVSNFFPKGDTRYAKGFGDAVLTTGNQSVSGIKTFGSTTNFSGGNVMLTSTSDQYFRANNVSSSGRKGLYMADGSSIDFKVYSGGNQTLGAFTEGVDLLVIGTGYQGGGAGSEKILFHSTGKGNMFSMNASSETNTSYFPLVVNGAVTASSFSGNATSATTLANTRTIWGQSFNGSGDVTGTLTGTVGNFGISNIGNWTGGANYARFGHSNFTSSGVYGFMQDNTGSTFINGTINEIFGDIRANSISGSGNRIIIADGSNLLKPAVIGSGLSFDGTTLTATGGTSGSVTTSGLTSGYLTKGTGASDIGNSNLQDNGTNLFTTTYMDFIRPLGSNAITIGESAGANRLTIGQESSFAGNVINSSNIDLKLRSYLSGGTGGNIIFYTGSTSPAPEAGRFNSSGNLVLVNSATATSFIKSGGTSSQFLMADGSAVTAIPSATTATTQTQGDNSTKIATTAYVDNATSSGGGSSKQSAVIFNDVSSSSSSSVNLAQHTLNTSTNGDKISFEYAGKYASNSNTVPSMILTVDGTDFTIPNVTPSNAHRWIIYGSIIRVSSVLYKINFNYSQTEPGGYSWPIVSSGATLDTGSLTITLTAPVTIANNDIVMETASLQKFNAP